MIHTDKISISDFCCQLFTAYCIELRIHYICCYEYYIYKCITVYLTLAMYCTAFINPFRVAQSLNLSPFSQIPIKSIFSLSVFLKNCAFLRGQALHGQMVDVILNHPHCGCVIWHSSLISSHIYEDRKAIFSSVLCGII